MKKNLLLMVLAAACMAMRPPAYAAQSGAEEVYASRQNGMFSKRPAAEKGAVLQKLLKKMEAQYNVSFMYSAKLKDIYVGNAFDPSLKTVTEQLDHLIKNTDLLYKKISDDFYVIIRKDAASNNKKKTKNTNNESPSPGQYLYVSETRTEEPVQFTFEHTVGGKVTDQNGDALPGVNVLVKGTSVGTTTDVEGGYKLTVADEYANGTLVFSFIGFLTKEEPIGSRTTIDIALTPDVQQLNEVVVVGYGTQKVESVTGAISSVSAREVAALPVVSVEAAIQGRVPGVAVINNGSPGTEPIVRIRGIGSISYASNPLYVIDGFAVQGINTGVAGFPAGGLNNFDTKDIESIDVLKDASAAAIYGSRAANGVIIVTTKKGRREGFQVDVDSYIGTQSAWRYLDLLDRDQYVQYATTMKNNAGADLPGRLSKLNTPIYDGATQTYAQTETDWQKEMFRSTPISHSHVSLSGGNDVSRIYSSASYFKQEGIMLGTGYERVGFRVNSDHQISKRFTFGQNLMISYDDRLIEKTSSSRTQVKHMLHNLPYIPVKDPTLMGGYRAPSGEDGADPENPVRIALQDRDDIQSLRLMANAFVDAKITNWLTYRFTAGIDYTTSKAKTKLPVYFDGFNGRNQAQLTDNQYTTYSPVFINQLTLDKTFGKHYVNATVVAEKQAAQATSLQAGGAFNGNDLDEINGALNQSSNGRRFETHLISYLGRVNYEYAGKYLFSASFRRDGSSVFAPGKKWGNFPAASVGWRISEEPFLKNNPLISELKIRASYGMLGFNGIGAYDWQVAVNQNATSIIGGSPTVGSYYDRLGNKNLEWEKTTMWNIGLDYGMLNNKLTFSMEVYNRLVDNLILQLPLPPSWGYAQNPTSNIGEMKNWGYEFQAGYTKNTGDLKWNVTANVGVTRNKVLKLVTPSSTIVAGQIADYGFDITRTEEGRAIQGFYGYVVDGIFQTEEEVFNAPAQNRPADWADYNPQKHTAPGDIRFKDLNNDNKIDAQDRQFIGSFLPDFNYGVNFSSQYKNFDLTLFIQGVKGNKIYNITKVYRQGTPRLFNAGIEVLDAWTPTNTDTDIPRMIDTDPNQNSRVSDRFLEDGSYLRLKNISLGYNVPATVLESVTNSTLRKVRVYLASQNLFTITDYTGYDPEIGSAVSKTVPHALNSGIDYGQYPSARSFMVGIQLGF